MLTLFSQGVIFRHVCVEFGGVVGKELRCGNQRRRSRCIVMLFGEKCSVGYIGRAGAWERPLTASMP